MSGYGYDDGDTLMLKRLSRDPRSEIHISNATSSRQLHVEKHARNPKHSYTTDHPYIDSATAKWQESCRHSPPCAISAGQDYEILFKKPRAGLCAVQLLFQLKANHVALDFLLLQR